MSRFCSCLTQSNVQHTLHYTGAQPLHNNKHYNNIMWVKLVTMVT